MSAPCVLGLDLGTSGLKAVLLAADGRLLAEADAPLTVQRPQPDWSEQHPADWLAAADAAVRALRQRAQAADWRAVQALAVAGQMHGAVLLDAAGAVLRPAMLWNDGRAQAQCQQLERRLPQGRQIAANPAMAGFTAPKLLWVAQREAALFDRVAKVLLPKDWLVWQLSGEMLTDTSDASGTWWLDVAARRWSPELLAATGLGIDQMPALREGPDAVGWLRPDWCRAWGLPERVQVAAGAGDNAAGAIGVGAVRPGDGFVSLGTSGVLFVTTGEARACPERTVHSFCHALPGTWHQMAVMLSSASALAWLGSVTGADAATLLAGLDEQPRADAPLFLPYLSGERTPHADPAARASLLGLGAATTRDDLAYAVIEGVAFSFADGLQALRAAGTEPAQLLALGGGARSDVWLQLLADVLDQPLLRPAGAEVGPALGAARLAQLSLGLPATEVLRTPPIARSFLPRPAAQPLLAERLARFRRAWAPCRALAR
ncbi:xylulokinase [Ideonella sp. 4Y11]|uniref:Xylulose kinase n=1 Tax=Ideonella aquatica TaxID=2824119 RepID=A0A940YJZ8_9BURK|nr:xylulokinase [Ideonella aquatica]MBQ0960924.1 xylulokinase [Ideonella aquatica]